MTTRVDQRDMTYAEVLAMPPSLMRDILLSSFQVQNAAALPGGSRQMPLLCQYVGGPRLGTGAFVAPILIRNPDGQAAHQLVIAVAEEMEDDIDWWNDAVHPLACGDGAFLAVSAVYDDWALPDSHPGDDPRDPADVPDAIATRFVRGVTADGAAFAVFGPIGGEVKARVELVADHPGVEAGYGVDRHVVIQQGLRRVAHMLRTAYAHSFSDPADYPPAYEPDPPAPRGFASLGTEHTPVSVPDPAESVTADAAGSAAPSGEDLTVLQVEGFEDSTLRTALLRMFEFEAEFQREVGWNAVPCVVIRHRLHGANNHQCYVGDHLQGSLPPATKFTVFHFGLRTKNPRELQPELIEGSYLGVSVVVEVGELNDGALSLDDASVSSAQVRVIVGMMRGGTCFRLVRRRGYQPVVTIVNGLDNATTKFGPAIMGYVDALNKVFIDLDVTSDTAGRVASSGSRSQVADNDTPDTDADADVSTFTEQPIPLGAVPNATLGELPPALPTPLELGFVVVRTQWRTGEPSEGRIYPPLPPAHPLANRLCVCRKPLANGLPVQTYTIGPANQNAASAMRAGLPHESNSALAHQQCVLFAAELTSRYQQSWEQHHG